MVLTFKELSRAIMLRNRTSEEEAEKTAGFILDLFGEDDYIIDNFRIFTFDENNPKELPLIEKSIRDNLRGLEEIQFIGTDQEEVDRFRGLRENGTATFSPWRIHYWQLKEDTIRQILNDSNVYAPNAQEQYKISESPYNIYNNPNLWENARKLKPACA